MKYFKEAVDNFIVGEMVRLRMPMYSWGQSVERGTIVRFDGGERGFVIIRPIGFPEERLLTVLPENIMKMNPAGGRRFRRSRKSRKSLRKLRKTKNTRRTK
jgi:hypothetical protein